MSSISRLEVAQALLLQHLSLAVNVDADTFLFEPDSSVVEYALLSDDGYIYQGACFAEALEALKSVFVSGADYHVAQLNFARQFPDFASVLPTAKRSTPHNRSARGAQLEIAYF